jgi:single-strand DNA-binding protein
VLNKVILIGRLTRDPEVRYTQSGKAVTTFDIAVDRSVANAQGQRETDFIPIVTWGKLAETCGNYLNKGRLVSVDGRLQIRSYEAQDGQKRRVAEVVAEGVRFLDRGKETSGGNTASTGAAVSGDVFPDDDIPF